MTPISMIYEPPNAIEVGGNWYLLPRHAGWTTGARGEENPANF